MVYRCPNCKGSKIRHDYSSKMTICTKCGKPLKNFAKSEAVFSTKSIKIKNLKEILTVVSCEDCSVSPETFDFLEEMMKRINPGTFSWDEMEVRMETYPSVDPYLEVDRTTMPETRPCDGSITVHSHRPDGKQAHFSIADFWDLEEVHHNPEFWWKDFEGKCGFDKTVKGHRKFDIEKDVVIEAGFNGETVKIKFRGKKPGEKVKPKKKRQQT